DKFNPGDPDGLSPLIMSPLADPGAAKNLEGFCAVGNYKEESPTAERFGHGHSTPRHTPAAHSPAGRRAFGFNPEAHGSPASGRLRRSPRRGRLRCPGRAARADGPAGVPAGAEPRPGRGRRLPG